MAKPPKLPWPVRLLALLLAGGVSVWVVEIYAFGAHFSHAVGVWMKMTASPPSPPLFKNEAGVVPVLLLPEQPAKR